MKFTTKEERQAIREADKHSQNASASWLLPLLDELDARDECDAFHDRVIGGAMNRAKEILGAERFDNIDHAAERIVKERNLLRVSLEVNRGYTDRLHAEMLAHYRGECPMPMRPEVEHDLRTNRKKGPLPPPIGGQPDVAEPPSCNCFNECRCAKTEKCELVEFHDGSFCRLSAIRSVKVVARVTHASVHGDLYEPATLVVDCGASIIDVSFTTTEFAQQEAAKIKRLIHDSP